MASSSSESGSCSSRDFLEALYKVAPETAPQDLVAAALQLISSSSFRTQPFTEPPQLHKQLAEVMRLSPQSLSAQLDTMQGACLSEDDSTPSLDQACTALLDSKMQLLFELWDRDGDGTVAFADVALAFRKFCPAMQRTQVTAADAVEAIYLYANGELHLDRLDFSRMVHGLCAAVDMVPEAMMDLLIILAAMDDRPADEMMFLLVESQLQRKHDTMHMQSEDNGVPHTASVTSGTALK